jgi:hypothetical protein
MQRGLCVATPAKTSLIAGQDTKKSPREINKPGWLGRLHLFD